MSGTTGPRGDDRRTIALGAAGIYGGAWAVGLIESLLPDGDGASILPTIAAPVVMLLTAWLGPRAPRAALFVLGPLGASLIAGAVATAHGVGDGAVLYMWPAVWTAYFFGDRGAAFIIAWIAGAHAVALASMADPGSAVDRWLDVVVAVLVVTVFVRILTRRNERLLARLAAEARVDPLTGLLNRRGLDERLEIELARAARDGTPLAIAAFDIDSFKAINDEHGHDAGDRVLMEVAGVLAAGSRSIDAVARVGGDEFVVVLPGAGVDDAQAFVERVCAEAAAGGMSVTISGGASSARPPIDLLELFEAADRSLYRAKDHAHAAAALVDGGAAG
jgi:diguanylate cyclase (GGDEF)-like protein